MSPAECIPSDERCVQDVAAPVARRSPMAEKLARWFIWSAATILILTAFGKISSAFGTAKILGMTDPIFRVPFRVLLPSVGVLELLVAAMILWRRTSPLTKLMLLGWIATLFVIYRIALWLIGWHHPCGCMGSLAGALHLTDNAADAGMRVLLAYLATGACAGLAIHFRRADQK